MGHFESTIRLVDQDRYRYRAIYSWENGNLSIVEHHHEIRESDGSRSRTIDRSMDQGFVAKWAKILILI